MNRIIIIEDHPVVREGLAAYFSASNRWELCGTASSLLEAKKLLADTSAARITCADIVLLDIQLDDGWGLDIIPWFTSYYSDAASCMTKMAVYSSFQDYNHVNAALSMGVKAYVTKRRSLQELEDALLTVLDGGTYIDEAAQVKLKTVTNVISLLTRRETEVFNLVKSGLSNKEIAANLNISHRTVENIMSCVYDKTGIQSRIELERL